MVVSTSRRAILCVVNYHVQKIFFALQSTWPPSHVSDAAFSAADKPGITHVRDTINTVILQQPEERNGHVYTTSFGDWAKGNVPDLHKGYW